MPDRFSCGSDRLACSQVKAELHGRAQRPIGLDVVNLVLHLLERDFEVDNFVGLWNALKTAVGAMLAVAPLGIRADPAVGKRPDGVLEAFRSVDPAGHHDIFDLAFWPTAGLHELGARGRLQRRAPKRADMRPVGRDGQRKSVGVQLDRALVLGIERLAGLAGDLEEQAGSWHDEFSFSWLTASLIRTIGTANRLA